jgi:hypothetical protein
MKPSIEKPSLAIFTNFLIDNDERLQRMKDSFYSFKDIKAKEWVINIRGSLKHKAGNFLRKELGEKLNLFYLKNIQGWMHDSLIISKKINSDYVLYWIEDHILITSPDDLKNCIIEMREFDVDQFWYSFFTNKTRKILSIVEPYRLGKYIKVIKLDSKNCSKMRSLSGEFYTVSGASIMRKDYFMKILSSHKPYLKRFHKDLPFNFEKASKDNIFPVIWHSIPNHEQFVPIDDNRGEPGYCLISRGLYPNRISRVELKRSESYSFSGRRIKLEKNIPKILRALLIPVLFFISRVYNTINFYWNK